MSGPPIYDGPPPGAEHAPLQSNAVRRVEPAPVAVSNGERATAAAAANAMAQIKARYALAMERPRSDAQVRQLILARCKQPLFAEKARYAVPRGGKKILGFSIRFAEEMVRAMRNVYVEQGVIYDDDERRILKVTVTDLERDLTYSSEIAIKKTVERRNVKAGTRIHSERLNSENIKVFEVDATEDDVFMKQQSMVSKVIRIGILRIADPDLLEEAEQVCRETGEAEHKKDPTAAAKRVADKFFALGIDISEIEKFLNHPIAQTTLAEGQLLRELYVAMTEDGASWLELSAEFGKGEHSKETQTGVKAVKQALEARKQREGNKPEEKKDTPPSSAPPAPAKDDDDDKEFDK